MNEQQILADRQRRVEACKADIDAALSKWEFNLVSEGQIGDQVKVSVMVQLQDLKKYPDAEVAQPDKPILSPSEFLDDMSKPGDKL
jgi:hypothetical protein